MDKEKSSGLVALIGLAAVPFLAYYKAFVINLYLTEFFSLEYSTMAVFAGLTVYGLVTVSSFSKDRSDKELVTALVVMLVVPAYMWVIFQVIT